jgi:hypothetical protein
LEKAQKKAEQTSPSRVVKFVPISNLLCTPEAHPKWPPNRRSSRRGAVTRVDRNDDNKGDLTIRKAGFSLSMPVNSVIQIVGMILKAVVVLCDMLALLGMIEGKERKRFTH